MLKEVFNPGELAEEVLLMISLNTKNRVTGLFEVSRGTLSASLVHPREVFKRAILNNASSIIIAHNHPSGDLKPSREDIELTRKLMDAGRILGISLLDHIIIGDDDYYSLMSNEFLKEEK
jgi:DNA repair protein RadC